MGYESSRDRGRVLVKPLGPRYDGAPAAGRLNRAVQARLGQQLRGMYDELGALPMPDRFRELIDRLQERDTRP